jgi:hypothetical protein
MDILRIGEGRPHSGKCTPIECAFDIFDQSYLINHHLERDVILPAAKSLLPTQEDLQEALRAVQRAKSLVVELTNNSDHDSIKEALVHVHRLLIERHLGHPDAIQEIRGNLHSTAKLDASTAWRSELREFVHSTVQMEE